MAVNNGAAAIPVMPAPPRISPFRYFLTVYWKRPVVRFASVIIVMFVLLAIFANFIAPYPPNSQDLSNVLAGPSGTHLLGTDALGRDVLSRIIFGSRISLFIGITVVFVSSIVGMGLGMLAGFFGGWINMVIMRIIDALMAFPGILLAMLIAGSLGGGMFNLILALSIGTIPIYARMMAGMVVSTKENDYVLAERAMGASSVRIMLAHLLPNCLPPLIVIITGMLGTTILAEAGMSFLGIGITPPTATWGGMVNDGRDYLLTNPILGIAPGIFVILVVFGFNMIGDGIRDATDPRLRNQL
jgi:peptide/nickel transport system permease protein